MIKVPGGIAGYSVVIATEGAPDFILTRGVANAASRFPVTPDTPFYIASQTKSYVGLLAARLDREGILPLRTTLSEVWPDLSLPAPADPNRITLGQLLSHRGGIKNDALEDGTAYIGEVPAEAYPRLLERASTAGKPGFAYSNLGYLIYAAALRQRTGRDWKAWLGDDVLKPLDLTETYSRSSLAPAAQIAWGHQWNGHAWVPVPPKSNSIMHAAGGLFSSPRDLAKWIHWQLREGAGQAELNPADFRATHLDSAGEGLGPGGFGIDCNGYGIGWSICQFEGEPLLYHGGTYDGVRSHLFLLPQRQVGVAILANSDGMTGGLGEILMTVIASSLSGRGDAPAHADQMVAKYREMVAKQVENRSKARAASEADPKWQGWAWHPSPADLKSYEGTYRSDLYGDLQLRLESSELTATLGVVKRTLRPAQTGLFGARSNEAVPWEAVEFSDRAASVDFLGMTFQADFVDPVACRFWGSLIPSSDALAIPAARPSRCRCFAAELSRWACGSVARNDHPRRLGHRPCPRQERCRRRVRHDLCPGRGRLPADRGQLSDQPRPDRRSGWREGDLAGFACAAIRQRSELKADYARSPDWRCSG